MKNKGEINFLTLVLVAALVAAAFFVGKYLERSEGIEVKESQQVVQEEEQGSIILGESESKLISEEGAASKGNKDAPVTIVEFSEYECPYCKSYVDETYVRIIEEYGDQIYYVFRDYPLAFHQHSQETAEAARCAGDQGEYWAMHDLLFAERDEWAEKTDITSNLISYAQNLGLNTQQFSSCLSSGKYIQAIEDDLALGEKVGVSGTPSFFINGKMLVGAVPFENFQALIEEELTK